MTISQSSSLAPDSSKANAATASIFAIIDQESKIDPSDESGMTMDNVKGDIELRNVCFRYPSRPDVQIFQDLNLVIHSGKVHFHHSPHHSIKRQQKIQKHIGILFYKLMI